MCKLGCMLSQAPTLWIRSGEISLTEKFINYCEEKSVTQITNSCVCVCVCVCVCARARARVCVCVCVCVFYVYLQHVPLQSNTTCSSVHLILWLYF